MAKLGRPAMAVLIMAVIIAVLFVLCTPRSTSRSSVVDRSLSSSRFVARAMATPAVRALVLDFDPWGRARTVSSTTVDVRNGLRLAVIARDRQ